MVSFFDATRQWDEIRQNALSAIDAAGRAGQWILGNEVVKFEKNLRTLLDRPFAVSCGSGLDAIDMALRASGLTKNDLVLTTPLSAFATTLAILRVGATPVFVDVDDTGLIDLKLAKEVLLANPKIRFFLPVHLYGFPLNLKELKSLAELTGVTIIEDCAQSIGARFDGRLCGSIGTVSALSFYPTKNLGALGDGGAVVTEDEAISARCFRMRDYGQSEKYVHVEYGFNSRLSELQASLLNQAILPRFQSWNARRKQIAEHYQTRIINPKLRRLEFHRLAEPVWHIFPILVEQNRSEFERHLTSHTISWNRHYPKLIPDQPFLKQQAHEIKTELSNAKKFADGEISLPIHPWMQDKEIDAVVNACNSWRP